MTSWLLRFLTMIGDCLLTDPPDTDSSETDAQKTDAQKMDAQKTDAQKMDAPKTDAQKMDAQKTDAQKMDAQKTDAQKMDAQKTDAQKMDAQKTDAQKTDAQKTDAQKTDAQKMDAQKTDAQKKLSQKEDLQRRILAAVRGLVVLITANQSERYSKAENVAYGALSICCARKYLDSKTFKELAPEFGYDAFYDADRDREEIKDPTTRLLQWAHLKAIEQIDIDFSAKADVHHQTLIQQKYNLALDRTDLRTVFNEEASGAEEDLGSAIIREELWNKIALLAIDMFDLDWRSLADEVSQRMAARETDLLGKIPPWGLRCLDHAIHVELAAMRAKRHLPVGDIREIIQSAYKNISYFLRSDFSLLRCSSGTVDPSWASDLWGLDSVIVCCSLLSVMLQEFLRDEGVVAEVFKPAQRGLEFPWAKALIHGNQHYPLFIRISLEDRRLDQDGKAFSNLFHAVKNEDVDSKLVTHISPDPDTPFKDILVTEKWSPNDLTFGDGRMCVLDFPFKKSFLSTDDGDLRDLLSKSVSNPGLLSTCQGRLTDDLILLASKSRLIIQIYVSSCPSAAGFRIG